MKITIEVELSLEHINTDLIDVNCDVELDVYHGSNIYDDPDEIEIIWITCNNQIEHSLNGSILLYKNDNIKVDDKLEKQILNYYAKLQQKH